MSPLARMRWLSKFVTAGPRAMTRPVSRRRPTEARLGMEPLECRTVPAILDVTVLPITPTEGVAYGNVSVPVPVARFTLDNFQGFDQSGQLSASIDWGDLTTTGGTAGPTVQFFQNFNDGRAVYQVFGFHTYTDATAPGAPVSLAVTVFDNTGPEVMIQTGSSPVDVRDQPLTRADPQPTLATTVGGTLTDVNVANFADGNPFSTPADFTATITWEGDPAQTSTGSINKDANGVYHVTGSHTFSPGVVGSSSVSVLIQDVATSLTVTNSVLVSSSAVVPTAFPLTISEAATTIPAGTVVGRFTDLGFAPPAAAQPAAVYQGAGTFVQFPGAAATPLTVTQVGTSNAYTLTTATDTAVPGGTPAGVANYTLQVTGVGGNPATTTGALTVKDAPLSGVDGGTIAAVEGAPIGFQPIVSFTDANPLAAAPDFSAVIDWGDGTTSAGVISQPNGPGTAFVVSASHTYRTDGAYPISVRVADANGSAATAVAAADVAQAAVVLNPTPLVLTGQQNVGLVGVDVATFTDANPFDTAATFGASINWGDGTADAAAIRRDALGVYHVQGTHTYAAPGHFFPAVTLAENDATGVLGGVSADVTIAATPLLVTAAPVLAVEGNALPNAQTAAAGTVVATFLDLFGSAPVASYGATIDWGNGQTTAGTVLADGPHFVVVAPANPAIVYPTAGTYPVRITVTKGDPNNPAGFSTATAVGTAAVADAPLTAAGTQPVVAATQNVAQTGITVAQFTDGNLLATPADFTATIDWGDGSAQSAGQVVQPGGAGTAFVVVGNHTYASSTTPPAVPFAVTVRVADTGGARLTTHTTANVSASTLTQTGGPVVVTGVEGQPVVSAVVATFADSSTPGPLSSYAAVINWGTGLPGSVTTGTVVPVGGNQFAVLGSYTYPQQNVTGTPYSVTVAISHDGQPALTVVSQARIADAPIGGVANPVHAVEGTPFAGQVGFFSDANPNGTAAEFTATINWGDGTTTPGTVVQQGRSFVVLAADPLSGQGHTYTTEGPYPIGVTVVSQGGSTFTAYQTADVQDAPLTAAGSNTTVPEGPVSAAGTAPTFLLATFTDAGNTPGAVDPPAGYLATINWGDGVVTTATVGSPTLSGSAAVYPVSGQHLYANPGTYSATVTVRTVGPNATSTTAVTDAITVTRAALAAGPPVGVTAVEALGFTAAVATFADGDLGATPDEFAATITWGDGTTSAGIIGQPNGVGTAFVVSGSHTYPDSGSYPVGVSVLKGGGAATTAATTAAVAGVAPTAAISTPDPVRENDPVTVTLTGPFDPSPADALAGFRYSFATSAAGLATSYAAAQGGNSASFTFPDGPATPTVFARVFDKDGLFTDYQTPVVVTNVAPTAAFIVTGAFVPNQSLTATLRDPADPSPTDTAAGFTYSFDLATGVFGARTASPTASFIPTQPGPVTIRGRVYDKDGGFTEYTFGQPVANVRNADVFVIGAGAGGGPAVQVHSALDNSLLASFNAYEDTFRGGVMVAAGDVTGDGIPDIVTGTGVGGGPVVKVFDGATFRELGGFFAYESTFRGGVFVAVADTDGDGKAEIITGTGTGGGPVVKVFDGTTFALRAAFAAYDATARGGVTVAAGDTTGDGKAEIITGAGPGGGPNVRVFTPAGSLVSSFFAYDSSFLGGVTVSAGDLYGVGHADIVTGTGVGGGADLRVFDGPTGSQKAGFLAFGPDLVTGREVRNGFTVSASHVRGSNGRPLLIAAAGPDYSPLVRLFDPVTQQSLGEIVPFEDTFTGGAYVG